MKRIRIPLAILLATLVPIWVFVVAPKLTPRIPKDWEWKVDIIGFQNWADASSNQWTEDVLTLLRHMKRNISTEHDTAIIKDTYETRNAQTGAVEWEYSSEFTVDKRTGMNLRNDTIDRTGF